MALLSNALRNALLGTQGVSELLAGGTIYVFSGPVPANADAALDMDTQHTQLVAITAGGGGLQFEAPTNGVLPKATAQTWSGAVDFDGAQTGASSLSASFYRFCASGDTGRAASGPTTYRIQGSAGGPLDAAEMDVGSSALIDNGANSVTLNVANIRQPAA